MNNNIVGYDPQTGQPIYKNQNQPYNTYQQFNQDTNPVKKKKLKWWIPVLFFVGGFLMFLGNSVATILVKSQGEFVLESDLLKNPIIMSFRWLAIICWLMVIPSLIIVLVKYNKKTPDEKQQSNVQLINMINSGNSLDEKLLIAYIGNKYEKIIQKKFSIPALFLSWIYTLYRKIYIPSIIGMVAIIVLGFLPSAIYTILVLAFVIVLGIYFNKWYIDYAKKQINKIKMNNANVSETELINICRQKGGTNIWIAILIYVVFTILSNSFNPALSTENNLESYKGTWYVEENTNQDTSIGVDELYIKYVYVEEDKILFDYTLSGLCGEKNIKVKMHGNVGEFNSAESSGTIELSNNKIIFKLKNKYYEETFERTFKVLK